MEVITNEHIHGENENVDIEELIRLLSIPKFRRIIHHDIEWAKQKWKPDFNQMSRDKIIDDGKRVLSIHHDKFFPKNSTDRMNTMIRWLLGHPILREIVLDEFFLVHLPFYESKMNSSVISS